MRGCHSALSRSRPLHGTDAVIELNELIENVAKYWRISDYAERDFVSAARYAVTEQKAWK
jgi:hypothetical protein